MSSMNHDTPKLCHVWVSDTGNKYPIFKFKKKKIISDTRVYLGDTLGTLFGYSEGENEILLKGKIVNTVHAYENTR